MSFLIFSEDRELAYQLLGKARELAEETGVEVSALAAGPEPMEYVRQGADKVYTVDGLAGFSVEPYAAAVVETVKAADPSTVFMGATKRGKELAPRVASMLGVGCMNDCSGVELEEGELVVERLTYGGSTVAREKSTSTPTVMSFPPRCFEKLEPTERSGEVVELKVELPEPSVIVLERREKPKSSADLDSASIIVSAGRGFKAEEDLRLLEEVAEMLGAQMGCSRPISADLGWMDQWVGISGKKVKPRLYVACGVSGTIQHVAGIRDSQIIVSINSDEGAGIHGVSDYSLVGDIYEVLPALTKALRERA